MDRDELRRLATEATGLQSHVFLKTPDLVHLLDALDRAEAEREIERLRADIEKLRDDRADLQERCNRLMAERNAAVNMVASADSEWKARAEKAERELDRLRSDAKTLAAEHFAADYRAAIARADKAEDERDEARAERDARPDISAEDARAFMMFKPVPARDSREGPVMHALRAHAAKAVKP